MANRVNLLAFDTSSTVCSVALLRSHQEACSKIISMYKIMPMQQGKFILPLIEAVLAKAALTLSQLDAIAYGCGPGSFTGVRIASSVAQGIGFAAKCHIMPISSLAAIAQAAYIEQQWPNMLVALDARMNEVYWAQYRVNAQGIVELEGNEAVVAPEQVELPAKSEDWVGVGDGWDGYRDRLRARLGYLPEQINSDQRPIAEAMLSLAVAQFEQGHWVTAQEAMPNYLR